MDFCIALFDDVIEVIDFKKVDRNIRSCKTLIDAVSNKSKFRIVKILLLNSNDIRKHKDFLEHDSELSSENMVAQNLSRLRVIFGEEYLPKNYCKFKGLHEIDVLEYAKLSKKYLNDFNLNSNDLRTGKNILSLATRIADGFFDNLLENCYERTNLLAQITKKIHKHKIAGIIGGPGVGKTSLAINYAQKKGARTKNNIYNDFYFIRCDNESNFRKSIGIDNDIQTLFYENLDEIVIGKIEELINPNLKYLIIFDGIEMNSVKLSTNEFILFSQFITKIINDLHNLYSNVDIIYTSRTKLQIKTNCNVLVGDFSEDEAKDYLMDIDIAYTQNQIQDIVDSTKLPILLNNIKNQASLLGGYDKVKSYFVSLGNEQNNLSEIFKDIFCSLKQSNNGVIFIEILKICSLLNSSIEYNLLCEIACRLGMNQSIIDAAIEEYVYKLNILTRSDEYLYIHPSYQDVIATYFVSYEDYKRICYIIVSLLKEEISELFYFSENQEEYIEKNILHIHKIFMQKRHKSVDFCKLLISCCYHYGKKYGKENDYYKVYNEYILDIKENKDSYELAFIKQLHLINNYEICGKSGKLETFINNEIFKENEMNILKTRIYYLLGSHYEKTNMKKSVHFLNESIDISNKQIKKVLDYDENKSAENIYFHQIYIYSLSKIVELNMLTGDTIKRINECIENIEDNKWSVYLGKKFNAEVNCFKLLLLDIKKRMFANNF